MSNRRMNEKNNNITENPFTVPEGYFESLEDRIRDRIHKPATPFSSFVMKVKPALVMALMFGAIAGLGWLASKVTPLLYDDSAADEDTIMAMIEEGYLESSFIYAYLDEIDIDSEFKHYLENNVSIEGEIEEYLEASLTEDDFLEYLDDKNIDLETQP